MPLASGYTRAAALLEAPRMTSDAELERLLAEAEARPLGGWDFRWLGERMRSGEPPWSLEEMVVRQARTSPHLLDLGTGGGEWLAALPYRPPRTVATESWTTNVEIARTRLGPLGVTVVPVEAAPDNVEQHADERRGRLPFTAESFALVVSRHESYLASEVGRVLVPGGRFLTQQIGGGGYAELRASLGLGPDRRKAWTLSLAAAQLEDAGLTVADSGEAEIVTTFADVGALAWYLKAAPWIVPEFSIATHRDELAAIHSRISTGSRFAVHQPAFWIQAVKGRARRAVG